MTESLISNSVSPRTTGTAPDSRAEEHRPGKTRQARFLTVYRFFPRSRLTESGENQPLVHLPSLRVSAWGPKESSYRPKLSWPRGSMAAQRSTVVLGQTCSTDILG